MIFDIKLSFCFVTLFFCLLSKAKSQEVERISKGNSNVISSEQSSNSSMDIGLQSQDTGYVVDKNLVVETMDSVIVTALGIRREKKSLGYSVQEVKGDVVGDAKDANFINSLSGKIAGLDISRNNSMGASSNVVIRGFKSLSGNNQALFVVDGTPVDNSNVNTKNQTRGSGGYDYGNAASDINPDDIESISVLKGAAATALYGSRASNGVILISTKKKSARKGIGVTYSSSFSSGFYDPSTFIKYQDKYGAGYSRRYSNNLNLTPDRKSVVLS